MTEHIENPQRRRIDVTSALMVTVTLGAIFGAAWLRDGRSKGPRPVVVGDLAPPLHLLDVETNEPLVLAGTRGRVVWLTFWSPRARDGGSSLKALEQASRPLRAHRRFALVLAAIEADQPVRVRAALSETGVDLPVYLASVESRRVYGALVADPAVHVLVDAEGRVAAIAQGAGEQTLKRIADQARRELDEIDPQGKTRFAGERPRIFPQIPAKRRRIVRGRFVAMSPVQPEGQSGASSSSRIRAATS
jgi:hypothetical protein